MKKIILHIICLLFVSISAFSQDKNIQGYRIDGDEVVFTFDKRDYEEATDKDGIHLDFADIDVREVFVSGNFNGWSMKKWRMTKIDENTFELRKKTDDFTDEFTWEFKFVVNKFYWAEPSKKKINSVYATTIYGDKLNTYNLKMFTANPDENGNLRFFLEGYENANNVVLSGTFNLWDERAFRMHKIENGWELSLKIKPGEYQYKFIVNGEEWVLDENNPEKKSNEFGGYNSFVDIKCEAVFILKNHSDAKKVVLSGSFNNWNEDDYQMKKTTEGWTYTIKLSGGKHHYKFIVDGEWIVDPDNSVKEYDYDGHINSVFMVK